MPTPLYLHTLQDGWRIVIVGGEDLNASTAALWADSSSTYEAYRFTPAADLRCGARADLEAPCLRCQRRIDPAVPV